MSVPPKRPWWERVDQRAVAYLESLIADAEARRSEDEIRVALIPRLSGALECRIQPAPRKWTGAGRS